MRRALALSVALATPALAAPAVTAQDLFDEVVYRLALEYRGPSAVRAADLRREHLPGLRERCAALDPCPPEAVHGLLTRMVASLEDAHTSFLVPEALLAFGELLAEPAEGGARRSLGVVTVAPEDGPGRVVVEVLPGSPAAEAGWRAGDVLLTVQGLPLDSEGGRAAYLGALASGEAVEFGLLRQGERRSDTLRARAGASTPVSVAVHGNVAVLRLRHFMNETVAQQLHTAVRGVAAAHAAGEIGGLVLDLRLNAGGLVSQFIQGAGAFMEPPILTSRARLVTVELRHDPAATQDPARYDGPLVVLVDRDSASASEFLAHVLGGRPLTVIAGEATAGVGDTATVVQELPDGSGLQITTARVHGADGEPLPARVTPTLTLPRDLVTLVHTGQDVALERAVLTVRTLRP